jgi:PAS domain S-box-containing protein
VLATLLYVFVLGRTQGVAWAAEAILAIAWLYSVAIYILREHPGSVRDPARYLVTVADGALLMAWIAATGGFESPFHVFMYGMPVAVAFEHGHRQAVVASAACAAAYLSLLALLGQLTDNAPEAVIRAGCVLLIGPLGAMVTREAWEQGKAKVELRARATATEDAKKQVEQSLARLEQAQATLQESEERFRKIFHANLDAVALNAHREGWLLDVNDEFLQLTGFSRGDVLGRTADELNLWVDQGERKAVLAELQEHGIIRNRECRFRMKDGTVRWALFSAAVAEVGGRRCVVSFLRDITEREQAAQALRESEERYRRLVELSPDPIVVQVEERFAYVNAAAATLLGAKDPREVTGRSIFDFIHPDDHGAVRERIRQTTPERWPRDLIEEKMVRLDGQVVDIEVAGMPITYLGRPALQLVARDITERRRAERELEESRRAVAMAEKLSALGTLVSGVAHEIRTPSTYVTNNLFLLRHRLELAAQEHPALHDLFQEVVGYCGDALEGTERINRLVQDLRRFTRGEVRRRVAASLHEVAQVALDLFRATRRGHIELAVDLRETVRIVLDRGEMEQVVLNLLTNAADAMPNGGTIRAATRSAAGGAEIEVDDEGTGIPPQVEARLFDPFFTTKADGTGLGLSIARRIVDSHGGTIRHCTQPGSGTRFTVYLPSDASERTGGDV